MIAAAVVGLILVVGLVFGDDRSTDRAARADRSDRVERIGNADAAGVANPVGVPPVEDAELQPLPPVGVPPVDDAELQPLPPVGEGVPVEGDVGVDPHRSTETTGPDQATTETAAVTAVPVVRGDIVRAGESCRIDLVASVVTFVVPDGLSARCGETTLFWTDPMSAHTGREALPIGIRVAPGQELRDHWTWMTERAPDRLHPVEVPTVGYRAWYYRYEPIANTSHADEDVWPSLEGRIIEAPGGTIDVSRVDAPTPIAAERVARGYTQLLASIRIEPTEPDQSDDLLATQARVPGGWCTGDSWTTRVPGNWFAGSECEWVAPWFGPTEFADCDCRPPIWVESSSSRSIDGDAADYGFIAVASDVASPHRSGSSMRRIEGLLAGPGGAPRRAVVTFVAHETELLIVWATDDGTYRLPHQSWPHVVAAHARMVEEIRFHAGAECVEGFGELWVAAGARNRSYSEVLLDQEYVTMPLPSGVALIATGCRRDESGHVQVRLVDDPSIVGWALAELLVEPEVPACPALDPELGLAEWRVAAEGDFDGDGRSDAAYVPGSEVAVAVVFADGGGLLFDTVADGPRAVGAHLTRRRVLGMGRDLLEYRYQSDEVDSLAGWLDFGDCQAVEVQTFPIDGSGAERYGYCVVRSSRAGAVVRRWDERLPLRSRQVDRGDDQLAEYVYANSIVAAADGQVREVGVNALDGPCGPTLGGRHGVAAQANVDQAGIVGDEGVGMHELSLQWISARGVDPGVMRFEEHAPGLYEVSGVQRAAPGGEIVMAGVLGFVSDDEILFDGRISTTVPRLNDGEPCVRNAGQRFIRIPGTSTFRMQDRINCDGVRTDWIDITLGE